MILQFLKDLANNNNKEWFELNRSYYNQAKEEFHHLLSKILLCISSFDASVIAISPEECTYRIHRDLRFTSDKTPYKTHFGGYINPYGKKSPKSGYYVHLEPGNCLLGSGSLFIPTPILTKIRIAIYNRINEYKGIIEDPEFTRYFPSVGESRLISAPRGFSKDNPLLKYIQPKDFLISYPISDDFFEQKESMEKIEKVFRQAKRLSDFINLTIDADES